MQLYFAPASYGGGRYGTTVLDSVPGMTLGAAQLRPESTGHVKALTALANAYWPGNLDHLAGLSSLSGGQ